jgi:Cu(I)/Ag(I) efflux system membrane fusion protein
MAKLPIFSYSAGFISIIFFLSCSTNQVKDSLDASNEQKKELVALTSNSTEDVKDIPEFKNVSPVTKQHINNLIINYDKVKNALVQSDFTQTNKNIENFIREIVAFNSLKVLKDEQDGFYLKVGAKLKNNAERVLKSKDLQEQRSHFSALSTNLYKVVKAFRGNEKKLYYQYCPMAFDNAGAYWLSLNEQIENPYFGDKMKKCGVVRETIK